MKELIRPSSLLTVVVLMMGTLPSCSPGATSQSPAPSPAIDAGTPAPTSGLGELPVKTAPVITPTPVPRMPSEVPYYQGKTIEIIVDQTAGGGTDTQARIVALFLTRYIPGNPKIIIRNQPGVAVAQNIFYERTRPDGFTLITSAAAAISRQLRRMEVVKYDVSKYKWVGNVASGESVILIRTGLKGRLTDPRAQPLVIGTVGGDDPWQAPLMWGKEFLGWNVRWLTGFGGTSEVEMAFRRGEVDTFGTGNPEILNSIA